MKFFIVICLILKEVYAATLPEYAERCNKLMQEIKCPVCQGQSVYDSQTSLAFRLRLEIQHKISEGASDTAIKQHLKAIYGDTILFEPPYQPTTWFLWLGPFCLLILACLWLGRKIFTPRKTP